MVFSNIFIGNNFWASIQWTLHFHESLLKNNCSHQQLWNMPHKRHMQLVIMVVHVDMDMLYRDCRPLTALGYKMDENKIIPPTHSHHQHHHHTQHFSFHMPFERQAVHYGYYFPKTHIILLGLQTSYTQDSKWTWTSSIVTNRLNTHSTNKVIFPNQIYYSLSQCEGHLIIFILKAIYTFKWPFLLDDLPYNLHDKKIITLTLRNKILS